MMERRRPQQSVAEMTRREALARIGIFAVLGSGLASSVSCDRASADRGPLASSRPLGLQLYTVRGELETDMERTLARVADVGYREVEFTDYFTRNPAQIAQILMANGLVSPAIHVGLDVMRSSWDKALDDAATVGHQYVVVPSLPVEERSSVDVVRKLGEDFNRAGEVARARGLRFAYHNHDYEFEPLGSTTCYDVLLATCDPAVVDFEMDIFWITKAGKDAVSYMTANPGRFTLVHVKDLAADGSMVDVGAGTIDFARIFAAAGGSIKHYFVEHDNPSDPWATAEASFKSLAQLTA